MIFRKNQDFAKCPLFPGILVRVQIQSLYKLSGTNVQMRMPSFLYKVFKMPSFLCKFFKMPRFLYYKVLGGKSTPGTST